MSRKCYIQTSVQKKIDNEQDYNVQEYYNVIKSLNLRC